MANLLLPVLLLGVMYFFLIVPQRKKQKAHTDLLGSLGPGDEVITSGGIFGGVTEVDGDNLYLEIAPDIEIKVSKRAIADRVYKASAATGAASTGAATAAVPAASSKKPAVPEPYETAEELDEDDKTKKNKN